MGIESDQVVYEYLSRVGDVAHQRQLPSATRMRLVSGLRDEIDRRRARAVVDSPAAVRRIIDGLGSPDDVVTAAGGAAPAFVPQPPVTAVPVQRERDGEAAFGTGPVTETAGDGTRPKGLRRLVPRPRPRDGEPAPAVPADRPTPPHLAGPDEAGTRSAVPADWWRAENTPFSVGDGVPGFVGGVEIPDLLKRPQGPPGSPAPGAAGKAAVPEPKDPAAPAVPDGAAPAAPAGTPRRRLRLPVLPRGGAGGWNNPLLLVAAALLVAGAVLGNLIALVLGWLIAWGSRRLTQNETKWAVMGVPGVAVAAGVVWLWGRGAGRWGDPIAQGHLNDAVAQTWPWMLRAAAIGSALFLVWRSQRRR
ncbi:hypothetical protein [Streptomyces sp. NPDC047000]|uniref:hypothetical protein n=1 Tax=Streptomyces sp. NPDC047000 TaxID=3155474 RepID=UPI0033CD3F6C